MVKVLIRDIEIISLFSFGYRLYKRVKITSDFLFLGF